MGCYGFLMYSDLQNLQLPTVKNKYIKRKKNATINHERNYTSPWQQGGWPIQLQSWYLSNMMSRPIDCRVGCGGMWQSHLLQMLWFRLPWMSVMMGWSRRVGGKALRRWIHYQQIKDEDIMASSRARHHLYKFLIRVYCGPLGKGVRMEISDCCLKGGQSLLKNTVSWRGFNPYWKTRTQRKSFKPVFKRSKFLIS